MKKRLILLINIFFAIFIFFVFQLPDNSVISQVETEIGQNDLGSSNKISSSLDPITIEARINRDDLSVSSAIDFFFTIELSKNIDIHKINNIEIIMPPAFRASRFDVNDLQYCIKIDKFKDDIPYSITDDTRHQLTLERHIGSLSSFKIRPYDYKHFNIITFSQKNMISYSN